MIELLKNPKNVLPWLVTGYALALGGYVLWHKFEALGRIIGFIGVLAIWITLLRVSLTRLALGMVIVVAVVAYGWWYSKSRKIVTTQEKPVVYEHMPWRQYVYSRKRPKYAESGLGQRTQEALFAPAFMFENVILFPRWRTKTEESSNPNYKEPNI